MRAARPHDAAASAATTATSPPHRGRAASATLPRTVVRLAPDFRPTKTRSNLTKRSEGRYNEPYAAIVEQEDDVSVLCVQLTAQRQVLVRHMPEREWQRIVRHGEEVYPGQEGESSQHLVAPPEMSTLPRSFHVEMQAASASNMNHRDSLTIAAATAEPAVFDYFIAPESRVGIIDAGHRPSAFAYLRLHARYKTSELQRIAREDCRATLAVERRSVFLRQYQRDMQCRLAGIALYTVGKELPEQFVQTFFMLVENAQAMRRYQARMAANNSRTPVPHSSNGSRRGASSNGRDGRYLFTLDQGCTNGGERMPFAGQAPADGFVVVTFGQTRDAFHATWRPGSDAGRFAWMEEDDDDAKPFVPYDYGSAAYLPRPAESNLTIAEESGDVDVGRCPSPPLPRFPDGKALLKGSGVASNEQTPLRRPSRSPSSSPPRTAQTCEKRNTCKRLRSRFGSVNARTNQSCTPSSLRLPLSLHKGGEGTAGGRVLVPAQASVQVA
ncbi:hypothetical protein ABB37_05863 [Leptomonas pyrrhocoris]|uniref:Uncharacterized protein n=1 Tax=Leptomonas pyrrhocoris TaxID=157538 RepID=A0A0M9FYS9_LEPPY|nr:hypothetical protein ABB37_05863 [Leptomonas pyrrhocoris]KPA78743.1 hypothetical protein ABB37_05863 [Leptomonas pyrrhocoris]|eukprot:XP_015657182.1 hypothetical protein ABB37_05863 [Leptomonas pyrrhocoris]